MFVNKSEAHERVLNAVEDIKACCEVSDYYSQWSDIAASSIQAFLEDLSNEQLDDTCGAFREYIEEISKENENLARGIKDALTICLNEMLDYIGSVPLPDEDGEDKDYFDDELFYLAEQIRSEIKRLDKMNV